MIRAIDRYRAIFAAVGASVVCPPLIQSMTEEELIDLLGDFDGWIIGDDPVTLRVLTAGTQGRLKAAVRWGAGTDNVDFEAATALGLNIQNTPGTFSQEVSDIAIGYLIGLQRNLFFINSEIKKGEWPKPPGRSLAGSVCGLIGYGHIGREVARKLRALGVYVKVYDPHATGKAPDGVVPKVWPNELEFCDHLIFTCALTKHNYHMLNRQSLSSVKEGVVIINLGRGSLIDELALADALKSGAVFAAALDVFEIEPLPSESPLRLIDNCVFGSHNSSNTIEAVDRTSHLALQILFSHLDMVLPTELIKHCD